MREKKRIIRYFVLLNLDLSNGLYTFVFNIFNVKCSWLRAEDYQKSIFQINWWADQSTKMHFYLWIDLFYFTCWCFIICKFLHVIFHQAILRKMQLLLVFRVIQDIIIMKSSMSIERNIWFFFFIIIWSKTMAQYNCLIYIDRTSEQMFWYWKKKKKKKKKRM